MSKIFVSQDWKTSYRNPLVFQKIFGMGKNYGWEVGGGGVSRFPVGNFLSHTAEMHREGTLLCFRKFRASKNFMHIKGVSRFAVDNFQSHSPEKLRGGTLLSFRKILVWKRFWIRGWYHVFPSETFSLTVPKNFVREPFGVSENLKCRKILCIRGGY